MDFHFGIKVGVISQNRSLMSEFVKCVPGANVDADEKFEFLRVFTFPLYVTNSLVLQINLWALPDDMEERGDCSILCCDAALMFYVGEDDNEILSLLSLYQSGIENVNKKCRCICCGNLSNDIPTKAKKFGVEEFISLEQNEVSQAFKAQIAAIVSEIPNPPDPLFLMNKNIKLGPLLLNDPLYKKALKPNI